MRGALILIAILFVFYMYTKSNEKAKAIEQSANPTPTPKPENLTATVGKNDTLKTIIRDIADIFGTVKEVVDGAEDRNRM